ncbi:EPIDERMAL PATTERNING FACTOR-like protein 1 [Mercurialis annua]|uniref:EPIDERMAL PATTERNING FACTOR-like protein 1 n=1 Tax=Mercurialis annua TaxID=3986 RepID=UPI00215FF999|nr:EPIDERMAL PATTERNING FACTOR-like protein 1 [Mercurialis annua]
MINKCCLVNLVITLCLLLLLASLASCSNSNPPLLPPTPSPQPQGFLFDEDKTRLGSTPPSCHNKCNNCHPCMPVQLPTIPTHTRLQPAFVQTQSTAHSSGNNNRYSNYKPLGWKCHCAGLFYNP